MAVSTYAAWESRLLNPRQLGTEVKSLTAVVSGNRGRLVSMFQEAPFAATTPSTAAACDRTTSGAIGQENGGANALRLAGFYINGEQGVYMLCDRLSHSGGLSGTVTGNQSTNLPTAALGRYTTGAGVFAAVEIYTQIGTTGTTFTASYTDQDGNTGQTSQAANIGGTGFREAMRMLILPLASGDTGVRAVASVNLVATTGTAGNFGITLFKPLLYFYIGGQDPMWADPILGTLNSIPEILDDACLFWVRLAATTGTGRLMANMPYAED